MAMAPNNKCDIATMIKPKFCSVFNPSTSYFTDTHQRYGYCNMTNSSLFYMSEYDPHFSSSSKETADISCLNDPNSKKHIESKYAQVPSVICPSDNSATSHKVSYPKVDNLEVKNECVLMSSDHKKEKNLVIGNTMKYLCDLGMNLTGQKKHILSNFDMNAISPTSW